MPFDVTNSYIDLSF